MPDAILYRAFYFLLIGIYFIFLFFNYCWAENEENANNVGNSQLSIDKSIAHG